MQTIHEAWTELEHRLQTSPEQRRYLRRIYYAGAKAIMTLLELNLSKELTPTLVDEIFIERLQQEMAMFERDMGDGRT